MNVPLDCLFEIISFLPIHDQCNVVMAFSIHHPTLRFQPSGISKRLDEETFPVWIESMKCMMFLGIPDLYASFSHFVLHIMSITSNYHFPFFQLPCTIRLQDTFPNKSKLLLEEWPFVKTIWCNAFQPIKEVNKI